MIYLMYANGTAFVQGELSSTVVPTPTNAIKSTKVHFSTFACLTQKQYCL